MISAKPRKNRFVIVSCGGSIGKENLETIEKILKQNKGEEGFILKVLKGKMNIHLLQAYLGTKQREDITRTIENFQKEKFDRDSPLIKILRRLDITSNSKVVLKDKAKSTIMDSFIRLNPNLVIFHFSKECFMKDELGDVICQIKKEIGNVNVHVL